MDYRTRYINCLKGYDVDHVPNIEMGIWEDAVERWHGEGMPKWVTNMHQLYDHLGMDKSFNCDWMPVNVGVCPSPVEKLVEETEAWQIYESDIGLKYKRTKKMSSIPQYIRFPVENRADYDKLKCRLDPDKPERYGDDFQKEVFGRRFRKEAIGFNLHCFFGFARELMGLENLACCFYDDPDLIEAMISDRVAMAKKVYKKALDLGVVDYVQIWEDMAYKTASLVSPAHMRKYFLDGYRELTDFLRGGGVELVMMDCDGYVGEIMPIIMEAGLDGIYPCEIAAGSDPAAIRKAYPHIALMGGVDKRALASGGREGARSELRRLRPVIADGKFIPMIDHFAPPDISYDTFIYYIDLKNRLFANIGMDI